MPLNLKEMSKDKFTLLFLAILLLGFFFRLQYYDVNTGFWWDESEYLNMGKHFAKGLDMNLNAQRPLFFPLVIASFYFLGLDVTGIRFFAVLLPSTLTILFVYLLGKELYGKKEGLLAAAMIAASWLLIFNTGRVHTDPLALMFNAGTLYFFWKGWVKEKRMNYLIFAGVFGALGFMTRIASVIVPIILVFYILITERLQILKQKKLVLTAGGISIAVVIPYLLWTKKTFGSYFAFGQSYVNAGEGLPPGWHILSFVGPVYLGIVFFLFMLIGLVITLYHLGIGLDLALKKKDLKLQADFLIILYCIVQVGYFIFIQRAVEDRWLMPATLGLFFLSAKGITALFDLINKKSKIVAVIAVIVILLLGASYHYKQAKGVIEAKKDSEGRVYDAGKWLAEHTSSDDMIMSSNVHMELLHASERRIQSFGSDEQETIKLIKETKPKYLVISLYYRSADWHYAFPEKYKDSLTVVKFYSEGEQPALWIFEVNNEKFASLPEQESIMQAIAAYEENALS